MVRINRTPRVNATAEYRGKSESPSKRMLLESSPADWNTFQEADPWDNRASVKAQLEKASDGDDDKSSNDDDGDDEPEFSNKGETAVKAETGKRSHSATAATLPLYPQDLPTIAERAVAAAQEAAAAILSPSHAGTALEALRFSRSSDENADLRGDRPRVQLDRGKKESLDETDGEVPLKKRKKRKTIKFELEPIEVKRRRSDRVRSAIPEQKPQNSKQSTRSRAQTLILTSPRRSNRAAAEEATRKLATSVVSSWK
ncbi:hypothetical protein MN608_07244 [Microdochium nivale]|nr:hypothetical protein MN608_07244 [Microdochium nivale]